jgi:hypothetical protein
MHEETLAVLIERVKSLIQKADLQEDADVALDFAKAAHMAAQAINDLMRAESWNQPATVAMASAYGPSRRPCWYKMGTEWHPGWLLDIGECPLLVECEDGSVCWSRTDRVRFQGPKGE